MLETWQRTKAVKDAETNARPSQNIQRMASKSQRGRSGKTLAVFPRFVLLSFKAVLCACRHREPL